MGLHARRINGNFAYYDTAPYRIVDAWGPSVTKFVEKFVGAPTDDTTGLPTAFTNTLVGSSTAVNSTVAGGSLLITTGAPEDNGVNMQVKGEAFKVLASKPIYFGIRAKISAATESDFIVGLCITDTTLLGGMTDGVYFRKVDGATAVTFVLEKDSTETESASVLAVDTSYHTYEIVWVGTLMVAYVDGPAVSPPALTNLVQDEELTPSIHFLTGAAAAITMEVDWLRVVQFN